MVDTDKRNGSTGDLQISTFLRAKTKAGQQAEFVPLCCLFPVTTRLDRESVLKRFVVDDAICC